MEKKNCAICNCELTQFNQPANEKGQLKSGDKICISCFTDIHKISSTVAYSLKNITLEETKKILDNPDEAKKLNNNPNKAGKIIAGIIVIALILLVVKCAGSCANTDETDDATVYLNAVVNIKGGTCTITNIDSFDYVNAKLTLNDKYYLEGYNLKANSVYTVGIAQFADEEGNRFDLWKKPLNFQIWCDLQNTDKKGFYYGEWK